MSSPRPKPHILTVNVEEYFHAPAFEDLIAPQEWDLYPARIERSLERLLDLLADHDASATFFVLGWVAERYPGLVRRVAALGHEVALHGAGGRKVSSELARERFRREVADARSALEEITGRRVHGYRVRGLTLDEGEDWLFDALVEAGFTYDASCRAPLQAPRFGDDESDGGSCYLLRQKAGTLLEVPLPSLSWLGVDLAHLGGASLRQLPLAVMERTLDEYTEKGASAAVYLRSWELDPGQPRLPSSSPLARLNHYWGLDRTRARLELLLSRYPFTSVSERFRLR